ncbi:N-acetylmuramoyl-L-alanine amidase [Candidatus Hepatincolaceae symbiont of Richtersius coronifer]
MKLNFSKKVILLIALALYFSINSMVYAAEVPINSDTSPISGNGSTAIIPGANNQTVQPTAITRPPGNTRPNRQIVLPKAATNNAANNNFSINSASTPTIEANLTDTLTPGTRENPEANQKSEAVEGEGVGGDLLNKNPKVQNQVDKDGIDYSIYQKPLGSILDVRTVFQNNGVVNIIFRVNRAFMADVKILNFPFRLMIDIPMPYAWAAANDEVRKKVPVTMIQGFRYGNPSKNVFRVVADLGRPISLNKAYVLQVGANAYDFIIEVSLNSVGNAVISSNSIAFTKDTGVLKEIAQIAETNNQIAKEQRRGNVENVQVKKHLSEAIYPAPINDHENRKVIVFLDPGHGGKDPGAIAEELVEKEITLAVALMLKEKLEANKEISVVLSRRGDYYVPLKDRVLWAQDLKANVFVSLHADKSEANNTSAGLSVYTLSDNASDAQTQLLANNANKSDVIAGIDVTKEYEDVNKILISLSQRVKVNESIVLGKEIIKKAAENIKILPNPLRSAGFAVLKVPNVPSILIELGFLSNQEDINNFKDQNYKNEIAQSLSVGIQSYLWEKNLLVNIPNFVPKDISGVLQSLTPSQ